MKRDERERIQKRETEAHAKGRKYVKGQAMEMRDNIICKDETLRISSKCFLD